MIAETQELLTFPPLLLSQAEVLYLAGREDDARAALGEAIAVSERKGALAEVRRARERLELIDG